MYRSLLCRATRGQNALRSIGSPRATHPTPPLSPPEGKLRRRRVQNVPEDPSQTYTSPLKICHTDQLLSLHLIEIGESVQVQEGTPITLQTVTDIYMCPTDISKSLPRLAPLPVIQHSQESQEVTICTYILVPDTSKL